MTTTYECVTPGKKTIYVTYLKPRDTFRILDKNKDMGSVFMVVANPERDEKTTWVFNLVEAKKTWIGNAVPVEPVNLNIQIIEISQ